ncbi:MAG TPA: TonB-dependent receptor, partial [Rubricoccaceae bacterium]
LITNDAIGTPRVVTGEDLENLPIRGVAQTVALQGGIVNTEGSNELNVRGGRAEEVQYYVDGVRVTGVLGVNQQAIEQQEVLIGTIPARYGDVQSGVISITTKTGRNDFFGSVEAVTSTGLDSFGYNLGSISLGGPIVANRLGFFLSAEGQATEDVSPYGADTYRLNDDAYNALQASPQVLLIQDSLGVESYIPFPYQLVIGRENLSAAGLQDLLLFNGILTEGQTVANPSPRPAADVVSPDQFELVRGKRDPLRDLTLNGNLNFTFGDVGLRLGGNYVTRTREEFSFTNSLYNRDDYNVDERDSYRFYGTLRQRLSNSAFYQLQGEFQDFQYVQYPDDFSSDINDVLRYGDVNDSSNDVARRYFTYTGTSYVPQYTGDGGTRPGRVSPGTFSLPGRISLTNFQQQHDQSYRFSGSATAQLGANQVEFGAEFQQETQRFFSLNAGSLASYVNDGTALPVPGHPNGVDSLDDFDFETLRSLIGARYGYNVSGTEEVDDQDINAYFDRSNVNIAPYRPTYYAGYVQDKIEFQDLVVQLGLRVDVFDNNTDVLKDIYATQAIQRAGALDSAPAGIESDFAVYYDASDAVVGYRDLDGNFYDAQGTRVAPTFVLEDRQGAVLELEGVPQSELFEAYEAQVTVMPRVGVSFPVTDRALFFASYNVTSQRPTERAFAPISSFDQLSGQDTQVANPRLEPERTTQYELGFRQRLGERAAISLAGFYRTQENKITNRTLVGALPAYGTFLNEDFTTTQGAEVNFDLRRTNNLQVTANYTLSFSQGTGSDAGATSTVTWRGDYFPRFINPSDFDQRHTANLTLDYRLAEGDGPLLGGVRVFENFGINLIGQFGSGQRYTRLQSNPGFSVIDSFTPNVSGTINGSTLPATTRLDLRVDRSFNLGFSDSRLRAYVQVQNLLNTQNRLAVYRATGQTDEDGYAGSQAGQQALNTPGLAFNYDAFTSGPLNIGGGQSSNSGFFYSAPRQVRLGFLFDF